MCCAFTSCLSFPELALNFDDPPSLQILLMSDMAEFDDLRLEIQKEKKKNGNTAVLGKVLAAPSTIAISILLRWAHRCLGLTSSLCAGHA